MDSEFTKAVEAGLRLAKRVYYGKDRFVSAPKPLPAMDKAPPSPPTHFPTAPMMYAVISDPRIVDNPDMPSYQPHVHGKCEPPALIPMQMTEIGMEVDCHLDTAFVQVKCSWRLHCVMGSRRCDCRFATPMGEQGSILGVEADIRGRSFSTKLMRREEVQCLEKSEHGGLVDPQMFFLTIPEVDGGSVISIKVSWVQKLLYADSHFSISIPFSFPEYILPPGKIFATKERIQLTVNTSLGWEVICKTASHPMKELKRVPGKLRFLYEADVITWSSNDCNFSYMVSSNDIFGGLVLQSAPTDDFDQRGIFGIYLFPGAHKKKVFRKEVIFLVDISGSMNGKPLENVKNELTAALFKLTPEDSFGIIAFNGETYFFSSSLESATMEMLEKATKWMSDNFVAGGETNITKPLSTAMEMFSTSRDSIRQIFLITDGAVEDERNICRAIKDRMINGQSLCPRISTFGIGLYCNHYFLQMLALIGRGHYGAAYNSDSINAQMQSLFTTAFSSILANVTIDIFEQNDSFEVHPFPIPDLSSECPLFLSGRYQGHFPKSIKAKGIFADMSSTCIELKVQNATDMSLDKVFAKRQMDMLTAQAWFSESKQLEEKIAKLSMRTGVASYYTCMVMIHADKQNPSMQSVGTKQVKKASSSHKKTVPKESTKIVLLRSFSVGFGDIVATIENTPVYAWAEPKLTEIDVVYVKTVRCCGRLTRCCCCPCCINACSRVNDQCGIVIAQLCSAFSCLGCAYCINSCFPEDS